MLEDTALLSDLAALRATGVAIGVTVTGPRQAETIDRALEVGIFDSIQATWNLIERSAEPALTRAHDAGLFVIVKEAMANGRLAAPAANPVLLAYAGEHGVPPDAVAIAAAVMQPWSNVVLSGAVSPEMFAAEPAGAGAGGRRRRPCRRAGPVAHPARRLLASTQPAAMAVGWRV